MVSFPICRAAPFRSLAFSLIVYTCLCITPGVAVAYGGAVFQGRVTDSASGYGIEGATVDLDLDSGGDPVEHTTQTDPFGFLPFPRSRPGISSSV
jgi:hypothetical protein